MIEGDAEHHHHEADDGDEQPEAGPGVVGLAQLDPDQPSERHPGGAAEVQFARHGPVYLNSMRISRQMPRASGMTSQIVPDVAICAHSSAVGL